MKLEDYPKKRQYWTNLAFPLTFWLVALHPRRGSDREVKLRLLEVGDHVRLPLHPADKTEVLYRVTEVDGDRVSLEAVTFRITVT